jgi:tetratricopeptide (TPR) repeat protein
MTCYKQAIHINSDDAQLYVGMAAVFSQQSDNETAIIKLQEAIRLNPSLAYTHTNFILALKTPDQLEAEISQLQKTIRLYPNDVEAHLNLGNVVRQLGLQKEVIATYRQGIRFD